MQSKLVTVESLKKNYQCFFNLDKKFDINISTILSGSPVYYIFSENIKGAYREKVNNLTEQELRDNCTQQIVNILNSRLEELNSMIALTLKLKFLKIFTLPNNKKILEKLEEEKNKIELLLNNKANIEKNVIVEINSPESHMLVGIPFYSLNINDSIHIVSQNFNSYLDIKKYTVKDIIIVDTKLDPEFNCDYEFTYYVSDENNNLLEIPHFNFRNFDGKKAQINEKFIFTDVDDAKEHCILVLNNLKNNIEDKINKIRNYNE